MAVWSVASHQSVLAHGRVDAEFFRPALLEVEGKLTRIATDVLARHFHISDGNHMKVSRYFTEVDGAVPYYRGQDLNGFFLEQASPVRIPKHIYDRANMHRSHFAPEDVLICIVGASTGTISAVTSNTVPCTGSCKIGTVRRLPNGAVDPYVLAAFLLGKFGQCQIERHSRGTAQGGLILKDIFKLLVPVLPDAEQQSIRDLLNRALTLNTRSIELYVEAQQLLEAELGLDKVIFEKPIGYTAWLSDLETSRRADAEFFHVGYEPFISVVKSYPLGWSPLGNLTSRVLPNFDARKHSGDFDYIEIRDVSVGNGAYTTTRINSKDLPVNAKIKLSGGEILFSQVRPTRGAISIVNDELDHPTISSGAFYVCKASDIDNREIIWLYLRSIRNVFKKYCCGTSYPTIDSRYIAKFPIPHFAKDFALRLRKLVSESKNAKRKSDELLEQAKVRVEQFIEEAVQP